ncbi:MAG: transposase [Deltaproteobacteria bacterium]|nr:transposase [Deltaproteobacteria bacterium]
MSQPQKPRNADHVRRTNRPSPSDEVIEERIQSLLKPSVDAQLAYYRSLGMRARLLSLPVMVVSVALLLWRQVPSVNELAKMLGREDLFWIGKVPVSQQALDQRFLTFPADLFKRVLMDLLPKLQARWASRQRPLPTSVAQALKTYSRIFTVDGSTLEALFCKLGELRGQRGLLAGKICTVVDLASRLPEQIEYTTEAQAHDSGFFAQILGWAQAGTLWIFDRGFYDFDFFSDLIERGVAWITRPKSNTVFSVKQVLLHTPLVRDQIVCLQGCCHWVRLIEVYWGHTWYRYLTSVLDPQVLPAEVVADLYRRRWRIEEAFLIVKRLLQLSYLWTGSENGVQLQVWATWLFFALLVDLGDEVANELMLPFDRISLEMVFRGLYHFNRAHARGEAADPVQYFAAPENQDLGIVKRLRKKSSMSQPQSSLIL